MKKALLNVVSAAVLFTSFSYAYDFGNYYYSPKRYVKSYLFSFDVNGQYVSGNDLSIELGMSTRYIKYFGNSDFNWGYIGNLEFSQLKSDDLIDPIGKVNVDIGPSIGYNMSKYSNVYLTGGYSIQYMDDFESNSDFEGLPYVGIGVSYFFNDDIVLNMNYKWKEIDSDNPWGLDSDISQFLFGLKITYR